MSKRFHIGENGPGECDAKPGNCPFKIDGVEAKHYSSFKEAGKAYEAQMSKDTFNNLTKNPLKNLNENSWKRFGFLDKEADREIFGTLSANKAFKEESKKELSNLSEVEQEAINQYTTSAFRAFNRVMFRRTNPAEKDVSNYKNLMENLDSAFEKTPKKDRILYRGLSGTASIFESNFMELEARMEDPNFDFDDFDFEGEDKVEEYVSENLKLGSVVQFDGYQSTSNDPNVAKDYANGGVVFEIKTPEGMNISSLSAFGNEQEVLLPRETRYMVVGVHKDEFQRFGGKYLVQLVAVNQDNTVKKETDPPEKKSSWEELTQRKLYKPV